ncbi:unnamed protein product [Adineta steineri]|uniref:C2H2-type domain-containing protein n=1 Tax=Adineta steineri TaxID=433720 RepID=A0A813YRT9_9BILA|nr:unnamed protein product [Adineta steineri]
MALNVHLQMYHKETGIITASNKYILRTGRYHCPVENCTFYCCCEKNFLQSYSFSNFNAVRLHYLRQHGVKKEQCSKCWKSFGLHQDFIAHEKICGILFPFSCSNCDQQFQNRTSLRRHQLKYHVNLNNDSQNSSLMTNLSSLPKPTERRKRPNRRRRPLPSDQIELSRQNIPSTSCPCVTINPLALQLLEKLSSESTSICSTSTFEFDRNKATQTNTSVSIGTECCSFNPSNPISIKTTEQKSSQTTTRIRMYKNPTQYSLEKSNFSNTSQWKNSYVIDRETQISSPLRSDICIQTVGDVSNLLDYSSELSDNNHNAIVQTLPISMTSTQMQTMNEYPLEQITNQYNNYLLPPDQESVGTSCFFDDFLLDDFSTNHSNNLTSSVLLDFDAIDLLDLIDNETQTYSSIATHETQTIKDWDNILLSEDEWVQTIMNS